MKDYYKILGIGTRASPDEIKKAYKKRARETHPDIPENRGKEEQFKDVSEAYMILSNPFGKQKYDAQLSDQNNPIFSRFTGRDDLWSAIFEKIRSSQGNISDRDLFETLFGTNNGINLDDLIDESPPFGNQQPIQIKEYHGIKEVYIESTRGDINFKHALGDLVVLKGTGEMIRGDDRLTLMDFSGDLALGGCEIYSKGLSVDYRGIICVGGRLETTNGNISLTIASPLKIFTDTMNGKVSSKGFVQKRGYIVPAGYEGSERPLYLKTLLGDITLDFKPVR